MKGQRNEICGSSGVSLRMVGMVTGVGVCVCFAGLRVRAVEAVA